MAQPPSPRFIASNTRSLKREGIEGKFAGVFLIVDTLAIKFFETRIWRRGHRKPLIVKPKERRDGTYAGIIRAFATIVAATGGLYRIERGVTGFGAWLPVALFGVLFLAAGAVGLFVLDGPLWQRAAPAVVPALLLAVFIWNAVARLSPRSIKGLAELDKQLP